MQIQTLQCQILNLIVIQPMVVIWNNYNYNFYWIYSTYYVEALKNEIFKNTHNKNFTQ